MSKNIFGKVIGVAAGVTVALGAAATASIAYGLKKWAQDEDSHDIKITTGCKNGIHISKTDDGKYVVDTKYDWATDPNFCDCDDCNDDEGNEVVIDISADGEACEEDDSDIEVEITETPVESYDCCKEEDAE